jgi:hypothetical protein
MAELSSRLPAGVDRTAVLCSRASVGFAVQYGGPLPAVRLGGGGSADGLGSTGMAGCSRLRLYKESRQVRPTSGWLVRRCARGPSDSGLIADCLFDRVNERRRIERLPEQDRTGSDFFQCTRRNG